MKRDIEAMESYAVVEYWSFGRNKALLLFQMIKQCIRLLFCKKDVVVMVMFAGYHSFIPALVGKWRGIKTWIVIGGTDASSYPTIHYGNFRKRIYGWFTARSIQWAHGILPVHEVLLRSENSYFDPTSSQGVEVFVPQRNNRTCVIENGFDPVFWSATNKERTFDFIAVAEGLQSESRRTLKGIDLLLKVAAKFPEQTFTVVGSGAESLSSLASQNVRLFASMTKEQLRDAFSEHKYVVQWSVSEGFPNALCEAMLCGCIPLVSNVTSMPEIIADTGFVLEKFDEELARQLISRLGNYEVERSVQARFRITANYPLSRRAEALKALVTEDIVAS